MSAAATRHARRQKGTCYLSLDDLCVDIFNNRLMFYQMLFLSFYLCARVPVRHRCEMKIDQAIFSRVKSNPGFSSVNRNMKMMLKNTRAMNHL